MIYLNSWIGLGWSKGDKAVGLKRSKDHSTAYAGEGAKPWHGARTRKATSIKRGETGRMRGFRKTLPTCNSGGMYRGMQIPGSRKFALGSVAHARSQNGQPPRSLSNSASILLKRSSKQLLPLLSRIRVRSGSSPWPTANVIHSNKQLSTQGAMPSTSGFSHFSGTDS